MKCVTKAIEEIRNASTVSARNMEAKKLQDYRNVYVKEEKLILQN